MSLTKYPEFRKFVKLARENKKEAFKKFIFYLLMAIMAFATIKISLGI